MDATMDDYIGKVNDDAITSAIISITTSILAVAPQANCHIVHILRLCINSQKSTTHEPLCKKINMDTTNHYKNNKCVLVITLPK